MRIGARPYSCISPPRARADVVLIPRVESAACSYVDASQDLELSLIVRHDSAMVMLLIEGAISPTIRVLLAKTGFDNSHNTNPKVLFNYLIVRSPPV